MIVNDIPTIVKVVVEKLWIMLFSSIEYKIFFQQKVKSLEVNCSYQNFVLGFVKMNQTTLPASWEICMQVKKQQLEPNMEQWTGSKLGKEYVKAVYCHLAHLTYMQIASCKTLGWMKHKLESRLQGEISITSDMQMTPPLWQKAKRN